MHAYLKNYNLKNKRYLNRNISFYNFSSDTPNFKTLFFKLYYLFAKTFFHFTMKIPCSKNLQSNYVSIF